MKSQQLSRFLFSYLEGLGVRHCFGIPGDYILPLYKALDLTPGIEPVVGTHEPCAAFSADAYARQAGLAVLLTTYGVGGFNSLNGVAGAYAESSPVLVISGAPDREDRQHLGAFSVLPHHVVKGAADQFEIYSMITEKAVRIDSASTAAVRIREAAELAMKAQRPVYLEIPSTMMATTIPVPEKVVGRERQGSAIGLEHAVDSFIEKIEAARSPILLVGVEVSRFRLEGAIETIKAARGIPSATTALGKGALAETSLGSLGVYAGVLSSVPRIREIVESSDLVIMLGAKVTDVNCGAFTANLDRDRVLIAKTDWIGDGYRRYEPAIHFESFVRRLAARLTPLASPPPFPEATTFDYHGSSSLVDRYLGVIDDQLTPDDIVVADTGDASVGSIHLTSKRVRGYIAPTFYGTMGFAVPAALGAQLARPETRPVVIVGDGAFQMTGLEMSNMVRRGLDPIIVLFDNDGFGMQRIFADGAFNDIGKWSYSKVPELVGGGKAFQASTPAELAEAMSAARNLRGAPSLIEVACEKHVTSTALEVMGRAFNREKRGVCPMSSVEGSSCEQQGQCGYCRAAIWE